MRSSVSLQTRVFSGLQPQQADPILGLIAAMRRDTRRRKVDFGIGVYHAEDGSAPVMRCVKAAEQRLLEEQSSKSYLSEGDAQFVELIEELIFGHNCFKPRPLFGVQTPGGTGALRLGAELIARAVPRAKVWIGAPTWPNHAPIFREAGLEVRFHPFLKDSPSVLDFGSMMGALRFAEAGDVLLLHGCCHNPTGFGFELDQWNALAAFCANRGVLPFVDLAYQGLGDGMEADAIGVCRIFEQVPDAMVAYSCDKNFALYRDRVGGLWVQAESGAALVAVRDNVLSLARSMWSMPPDHGAAVVRTILERPELSEIWQQELTDMRTRLGQLRQSLAAGHPFLNGLIDTRGLFALLPIGEMAIQAIREKHGFYMPSSGRINISGLNGANLQEFILAIGPYLPQQPKLTNA